MEDTPNPSAGTNPCTLFGQARHYRCLPERLPACSSLPPLLPMPFPRNLSSWKRGAGVQSSRLTFNPLAPILGERRRPEGHPQTPGGKHAAPLLRQPPCIAPYGHPRAEPNAGLPSNRRLACCASLLLRGNQAQCQDMYIGNCLACLSGNSRQEPKKRHAARWLRNPANLRAISWLRAGACTGAPCGLS